MLPPRTRRPLRLSVSSIGTNELQLDERTENGIPLKILSVSSIGTNELQPRYHHINNRFGFRLSVSSIGTNELQLIYSIYKICSLRPFSFLYRNERTATIKNSTTGIGVHTFQFPLSERTNCNGVDISKQDALEHAFSFLYRNERTATNGQRVEKTFVNNFQFPLSERTNCNITFTEAPYSANFLSVSSIGTNELQHYLALLEMPELAAFSFLYRNERTATRKSPPSLDEA